jgi:hypothetical protein
MGPYSEQDLIEIRKWVRGAKSKFGNAYRDVNLKLDGDMGFGRNVYEIHKACMEIDRQIDFILKGLDTKIYATRENNLNKTMEGKK